MTPRSERRAEPLEPTVPNLLAFEAANPTDDLGWKAIRIRDTFHLSPVRYARLLNRMLEVPDLHVAALSHDPMTTHRLERDRDARAQARKARFA